MPTVGESDFKARFPAFDTVPSSTLTLALADAEQMYSASAFASEFIWQRVIMLRAAHDMTMRGVGEGAEAKRARMGLTDIVSINDGAVSITRRPASNSASSIEQSEYGRALMELIRSSSNRIVVGGYPIGHA